MAAIDLANDKLLSVLDLGKTPIHLALKPDGGEIFVSDYDSDAISVIETTANEVGNTFLIGTRPVRSVVSSDNTMLYTSDFGSNSISIYEIDIGKMLGAIPVGSGPDALALSHNENFLLVVNSKSGDVAVVRTTKLPEGSKISAERALFTMIPVGAQPNDIVVKSFTK